MKKLLLLAFAFALVMQLNAQENVKNEKSLRVVTEENTDKYKVETNRFWSNWFVTIGGGAQIFFGDHNRQMDFIDRISPSIDAGFGKWFTPGIGVRLMYNGWNLVGATQNGSHSTGEVIPEKNGSNNRLTKQKYNYFLVHADVLFNLTQMLDGYNENRVVTVSPYLGLGLARVYDNPKSKEIASSLGALAAVRLSSALDLNLDVRGTMVNDRFDGELGGRQQEGALSATIGLTYKLSKRNWDRSKIITVYDETDLNSLRKQFDELDAENERLKRALIDGNQKEVEKIVERIQVASPCLVVFDLGKSKLSKEARVNLGLLAEVIKTSDRSVSYVISGYADKGTGNSEINNKLSENRAKAVYDCLVEEYGVPANQLTMEANGGVENMFYDDPRLSRAVITRAK